MTRARLREVVFLNGRFVPAARARVSALDRGLLYGDGLFETVRIYRGTPFALTAHLRRMRQAAERIRLRLPRPTSGWNETIADLLHRNGLQSADAALRVTVTRGSGGEGLVPPRRTTPTLLLQVRPLPSELAGWQERGVDVTLLPFHPGSDGYLSGFKTTQYLTALVAKIIAHERGAFEGIYQNRAGEILEGATSNVFIVRGGTLETPPLSRGILPGITRELVLRLARENGYRARERSLRARDLVAADAAFLTASTIEIVPIRRLDGRRLRAEWRDIRRLQGLLRGAHESRMASPMVQKRSYNTDNS